MSLTIQPVGGPAPAENPSSRRYTREEYFELPEGPPHYELINGELVMSPRPLLRHQQLLMFLTSKLWPHAVEVLGGELLAESNFLVPGTDDVVHPDFLYLTPARLDFLQRLGVEGAPDLVCEILSPSTRRYDRGVKLQTYQKVGVPHVWLIEPQSPVGVEEFVLEADGRYRLQANLTAPDVWTPALFPGWSLDLGAAQARLFPGTDAKNSNTDADAED
jgi:Uma2 family endonuclease